MVETEENQQRMLSKALSYLSNHAIAILALVFALLALAGASYAAVTLPKNSVGNQQIRNQAITPNKLDNKVINGSVRLWARVSATGKLVGAHPRARLVGWRSVSGGLSPGGVIEWKQKVPSGCFSLATVETFPAVGYASTETITTPADGFNTQVRVALSGPEPVAVAVIC